MTHRQAAALLLGTLGACCRGGTAPTGGPSPPAVGASEAGPAASIVAPIGSRQPATGNRSRGCAPETAARIPTEPDPMTYAPRGVSSDEISLAALPPGDGPPVAAIETSEGVLRCTLDPRTAPRTVANFVGLATGRRPWWDPCRARWVYEPMFDGMTFHKSVAGFVAQTGCPIGDGTSGPGYVVPDEIGPRSLHDAAGVLSMANLGPDTAGSQFFVALGPAPALDRRHTTFGRCGPPEAIEALDRAAARGATVRVVRVTVGRGPETGGAE